MKLTTLTFILAAGLSASTFGQGVILENVGTGVGGTNGAVYVCGFNGPTKFDGIHNNVGASVYGGPSAGSLQPLGLPVYKANTDPKGYTGSDIGTFQLGAAGTAVNVPGVAAGGVATIRLQMWYDGASPNGLFTSFNEARNSGGLVADVTFLQRTGNPPLVPPPLLNGMPDIILGFPEPCIPEPATLAIAGFGLAALLLFRRRE